MSIHRLHRVQFISNQASFIEVVGIIDSDISDEERKMYVSLNLDI
jgi:hypothetical protein